MTHEWVPNPYGDTVFKTEICKHCKCLKWFTQGNNYYFISWDGALNTGDVWNDDNLLSCNQIIMKRALE